MGRKKEKMAEVKIDSKKFREFAARVSSMIQDRFKRYKWELGLANQSFSFLCKVEREKLPLAMQRNLGALSKEKLIGLARVEGFLQGDKFTIVIERFDWSKKDYVVPVARKDVNAGQLFGETRPEAMIIKYISGELKKFI